MSKFDLDAAAERIFSTKVDVDCPLQEKKRRFREVARGELRAAVLAGREEARQVALAVQRGNGWTGATGDGFDIASAMIAQNIAGLPDP